MGNRIEVFKDVLAWAVVAVCIVGLIALASVVEPFRIMLVASAFSLVAIAFFGLVVPWALGRIFK